MSNHPKLIADTFYELLLADGGIHVRHHTVNGNTEVVVGVVRIESHIQHLQHHDIRVVGTILNQWHVDVFIFRESVGKHILHDGGVDDVNRRCADGYIIHQSHHRTDRNVHRAAIVEILILELLCLDKSVKEYITACACRCRSHVVRSIQECPHLQIVVALSKEVCQRTSALFHQSDVAGLHTYHFQQIVVVVLFDDQRVGSRTARTVHHILVQLNGRTRIGVVVDVNTAGVAHLRLELEKPSPCHILPPCLYVFAVAGTTAIIIQYHTNIFRSDHRFQSHTTHWVLG